jgi:hypothetical protein
MRGGRPVSSRGFAPDRMLDAVYVGFVKKNKVMEMMIYTFGGWGGIFLRSRTWRRLSVHSWEGETTGYFWIDGDRITYSILPPSVKTAHNGRTKNTRLTEFLPEALWVEMIEGVVSDLSGRHRCSKIEFRGGFGCW